MPTWLEPPYLPDASADGFRPEAAIRHATTLTLAAFLLVTVALGLLLVLYRERAGRHAAYLRGDGPAGRLLAAGVALAMLLLADWPLVARSTRDAREWLFRYPEGPEVLHVEVLARQWTWSFRYPGADGAFDTADDVVTLDELVVPVGRPVAVHLKAVDVIHSLYLPAFRLKQDAIPGRVTRTWFAARRTGRFDIACSQLCGWAHYLMHGELHVVPADRFEAWYREEQATAVRRFDPEDREARWGWEVRP